MDDLALEVGLVHHIVIHERERAEAASGEIEGGGGAEAAQADDGGAGAQQRFLAGDIDLRQHDLAAVAQQLFVVHGAARPQVTTIVPSQVLNAGDFLQPRAIEHRRHLASLIEAVFEHEPATGVQMLRRVTDDAGDGGKATDQGMARLEAKVALP